MHTTLRGFCAVFVVFAIFVWQSLLFRSQGEDEVRAVVAVESSSAGCLWPTLDLRLTWFDVYTAKVREGARENVLLN